MGGGGAAIPARLRLLHAAWRLAGAGDGDAVRGARDGDGRLRAGAVLGAGGGGGGVCGGDFRRRVWGGVRGGGGGGVGVLVLDSIPSVVA